MDCSRPIADDHRNVVTIRRRKRRQAGVLVRRRSKELMLIALFQVAPKLSLRASLKGKKRIFLKQIFHQIDLMEALVLLSDYLFSSKVMSQPSLHISFFAKIFVFELGERDFFSLGRGEGSKLKVSQNFSQFLLCCSFLSHINGSFIPFSFFSFLI